MVNGGWGVRDVTKAAEKLAAAGRPDPGHAEGRRPKRTPASTGTMTGSADYCRRPVYWMAK